MVTEKQIKVKGKEYWILIHSVRKGKKVIQKKKYIGKSLPPKSRLEQLKKEFLKELSGDKYKYLSKEDLEKIENKKTKYKQELRKLGKIEKEKKLNEFMIRYTYDSSKLSGVNITLRQTFLILKEGIIPQDFKNLRIAKEVENHEKGFIAITKYKGKFDVKFIKKLHFILFSGIDDSIAGKLRNELKRDVKIAGTAYVPPKWTEVKRELDNFFNWYSTNSRKLHPLELASLIHLRLISIQPFVDGNSRLSRLLMNWVLWKKGYPLIDIPIEDLENYYDVLDNYQIEKNEKPFITYIKKKYLSG
ncbi:MAG: Fic family protein [Nanoarchaeota archaeon]|nr:Fic family protein [Nanoarchaeota archaeon]MBU1028150.1 Fic family protein [Nanoarchaeota archaeon]